MPQLTLTAPDITCEHCIETIRRTVDAQDGARFIDGDPEGKRFSIEVERGAVLDVVAEALRSEGYPLGEASAPGTSGGAEPSAAVGPPAYRVTRTEAGADVNYDCPCGCEAGFALDRSRADQAPESCCCGRKLLVGAGAEAQLRAALDDPEAYEIDVQQLSMPWGQPMEAALAIPREGAHHGANTRG